MSPLDPEQFTDMDGNAVEGTPEPLPSLSAAAVPISWSSSDGARRTILTPPSTWNASNAAPTVPRAKLCSRPPKAGTDGRGRGSREDALETGDKSGTELVAPHLAC